MKRGLIAAAGGVFRIVDQLPRKVALELMFTGEPMTSADALKWGLINKVVPDGTVGRRGARAGRADHCQRAAGRSGQQAGRRSAPTTVSIAADEPGWKQDHARNRAR